MSRALKVAVHIAMGFAAYVLAHQLVLMPGPSWWASRDSVAVLGLAVSYAAIAAAVEATLRVERSAWRYVSMSDGFGLFRSTLLTAAVFLLLVFLLKRADGVPRSVFLFAWILHLGGLATMRALRRLAHERSLVRVLAPILYRKPRDAPGLLLVGEVGAADAFLRELARETTPRYAAIAILSMNAADVGQTVRDVPVVGTFKDLESTALRERPAGQPLSAILFLSPPNHAMEFDTAQVGRLKSRGLALLRLPAVTELSAAYESLPGALREVSVEELLARPPISLDLERIHELVNGKRVLVTGAGGSIGSEICRQVIAYGCAHLSMVDQSEFGLFTVDQEISLTHPRLSKHEIICDVRNQARVTKVIKSEAPDIIFHAAALKHVPLVEGHPGEGVLTNVVGTWNVAEAARLSNVRQMVMISTDKAVDPNNVMGATKRLAEGVVRGRQGLSRTAFSVVRFGNVLGSSGSVVPTFQAQIERGGPVTVTHPDVERYFMTIPEAVQLVLHATAESAQRDLSQPSVFVLDMGEPVKIVDLARNMIMLHGLEVGAGIDIVYTGLRPGEKLTEELIDGSECVVARSDVVVEVVESGSLRTLGERHVRELETVALTADNDGVRNMVYQHVARLRGVEEDRAAS